MVVRNSLNTLPVDSGWAWAIVTAGVISAGLVAAFLQTTALLFVEILMMYKASITTGSLMFMFGASAGSLSSVVVINYAMPKLKQRGCLLLGGILSFVLTLGLSFAPNIDVFIAIFTAKCIVCGLNFVPAISLIPRYFQRYRSWASVLPFCGVSAASLVGPFIVRVVREEYGIRGVYIIMSAVDLHYCLAGLLLRPVSAYRFHPDDAKTPGNNASAVQNPDQANPDTNNHVVIPDVAAKERNKQMLQVRSEELTEDVEAAQALLDEDDVNGTVEEKTGVTKRVDFTAAESDNTESLHSRDRPSTLSRSAPSPNNISGTVSEEMKDNTKKNLGRWQTFYQASSLELRAYRWMLVSVVPGSAAGYVYNYMPTICKFQGASFEQAAILTTIMGTADLVSRISVGFIADTKVVPPSKIFIIALICLGIGCHFVQFATSFVTLIPMVLFIGLFVGTRGPLPSLLALEVAGPKKFPQAYSLLNVVFTLGGSLFNPALGAVAESTGSFFIVLHILGISFLLGAGLLACLPLFVRLDVKQGRKK